MVCSQWLTDLAQNSVLMQNHHQVNVFEGDCTLKKTYKLSMWEALLEEKYLLMHTPNMQD